MVESIDGAFADIAARVHPQAQENGRAARPSFKHIARKIAPAKHWRHEVRRVGDAIVPASARSIAAGTAAGARACAAGTGAGTANVGRALRWCGSLPGRFRGWDGIDRRRFDPRLGRDDRTRLALGIFRRRAPLLLFWLWRL